MKSPKDWSIDEWYSFLSQRNELRQQLDAAQNKIHQLEKHKTYMTTLRPIQFEHRKHTPAVANPYSPAKWETLTLTGHFHAFSTEGDGQELCPVAIIETPDGQIYTPAAHKCKFLDTQPILSSVKTSDTI